MVQITLSNKSSAVLCKIKNWAKPCSRRRYCNLFVSFTSSRKNKKIKINNSDFDNATIFSYLRHGIYVDRIKIWMTLFGKNQFLILNTEELAENTDKTLNKIFEFLDVPHYKIPDLRRRNVGKYEKMQESTREFLINFYKPHNQRLYKFLNRRFDWDK